MTSEFNHRALDLKQENKIVFTAMSKHTFYFNRQIAVFVVNQGFTPISPFGNFDYFLTDACDRKKIINGNNNLVRVSDELWVFGPISDGVLAEIKLAKKMGKSIKYFAITRPKDMQEIKEVKNKQELEFESTILKEAFFKDCQ